MKGRGTYNGCDMWRRLSHAGVKTSNRNYCLAKRGQCQRPRFSAASLDQAANFPPTPAPPPPPSVSLYYFTPTQRRKSLAPSIPFTVSLSINPPPPHQSLSLFTYYTYAYLYIRILYNVYTCGLPVPVASSPVAAGHRRPRTAFVVRRVQLTPEAAAVAAAARTDRRTHNLLHGGGDPTV